jgi:DNA invertase Pin-like site-specific DNA recombinase
MTGKRIGYIRVSTIDQNPDRQLDQLQLDKKFIEYASAKSTIGRPQLQQMLEFVREDDVIFVHSMDRLARNVYDLKKLVTTITEKKVKVCFVKENLEFTNENSSFSNLMLHILGSFAEFEYAFIRERQQEGIVIAKKLGRFKGRSEKLNEGDIEILKKELLTRKSKTKIAEELGISRTCLYKYLEKLNIKV